MFIILHLISFLNKTAITMYNNSIVNSAKTMEQHAYFTILLNACGHTDHERQVNKT